MPKGPQDGDRTDRGGRAGAEIRQIIGFATQPIAPGEWVHEHNLAMGGDFDRDYQFAQGARPETTLPDDQRSTFEASAAPTGGPAPATISRS